MNWSVNILCVADRGVFDFFESLASKNAMATRMAINSAFSFISKFMALSFVDGWCENPIVKRSGRATQLITKEAAGA